jgi:hypothetical protein
MQPDTGSNSEQGKSTPGHLILHPEDMFQHYVAPTPWCSKLIQSFTFSYKNFYSFPHQSLVSSPSNPNPPWTDQPNRLIFSSIINHKAPYYTLFSSLLLLATS